MQKSKNKFIRRTKNNKIYSALENLKTVREIPEK